MEKYFTMKRSFEFSGGTGNAYSNIDKVKEEMFDHINEVHGRVINIDTLTSMGNPVCGCGIVSIDYAIPITDGE